MSGDGRRPEAGSPNSRKRRRDSEILDVSGPNQPKRVPEMKPMARRPIVQPSTSTGNYLVPVNVRARGQNRTAQIHLVAMSPINELYVLRNDSYMLRCSQLGVEERATVPLPFDTNVDIVGSIENCSVIFRGSQDECNEYVEECYQSDEGKKRDQELAEIKEQIANLTNVCSGIFDTVKVLKQQMDRYLGTEEPVVQQPSVVRKIVKKQARQFRTKDSVGYFRVRGVLCGLSEESSPALDTFSATEIHTLIKRYQQSADANHPVLGGIDYSDRLSVVKLHKNAVLRDPRLCGAIVASAICPVEVYKHTLLGTIECPGQPKPRKYTDDIKQIFTREFRVFYRDALLWCGAGILDPDDFPIYHHAAKEGVNNRADLLSYDVNATSFGHEHCPTYFPNQDRLFTVEEMESFRQKYEPRRRVLAKYE